MQTLRSYMLCFGLSMISVLVIGQEARDYVSTDSAMVTGIKLVKGRLIDLARYVESRGENESRRYLPDDIDEYGFGSEITYRSFTLKIDGLEKKWFLRELYQGEFAVYMLALPDGNRFYMQSAKDEVLVSIPSEGLTDFLIGYVNDCKNAVRNARYVKLNMYHLIRFFKDYSDCAKGAFPRFRMGFGAGLHFSRFSPSSNSGIYLPIEKDVKIGIEWGAQVSIPIRSSNYSWVTGVHFQSIRGSSVFNNGLNLYDLVIDEWRLNIPIALRYSLYRQPGLPYFEVGAIYSRQLNNRGDLFWYDNESDGIYIIQEDQQAIHQNQVGLMFNGGMTFNYRSKFSYFVQVGYSQLYSRNGSIDSIDVGQWRVIIGLLF